MSAIHSGPVVQPRRDGLCGWRHHFCGVWLACDDTTIPGGALCAEHFIAAARLIPRKGHPAA